MEAFEVRSTKVAAFLIARGHRVIKTSRGDQAIFFHFVNTPKLEDDVQALRFGNDAVSARSLYSARDYLMTLIHEDGGFER